MAPLGDYTTMKNPWTDFRKSKGLTRKEVACKLGIPHREWEGHENGRFPSTHQALIDALLNAGYPGDDLALLYDAWRRNHSISDQEKPSPLLRAVREKLVAAVGVNGKKLWTIPLEAPTAEGNGQ